MIKGVVKDTHTARPTVQVFSAGETVVPFHFPDCRLVVGDVIPEAGELESGG